MTNQRRVAVVTGAAQGLGAAFAIRLAQDGRDVVLADLRTAEETAAVVRAEGAQALVVECDVTNPDSVADLAQATRERFGRCDILVNNAGIYPIQPFAEITFADWKKVQAVNIDAVFLACSAFVPMMRDQGWGRVVNIASNVLGLVVEGLTHYVSSKGAVVGFTRALASEVGVDGVIVNAIASNLTKTPGSLSRSAGAGGGGQSNEDEFAMLASMQAIKRSSMPADLVGPMSFLSSDDSVFVTGQTIYADGGLVRV